MLYLFLIWGFQNVTSQGNIRRGSQWSKTGNNCKYHCNFYSYWGISWHPNHTKYVSVLFDALCLSATLKRPIMLTKVQSFKNGPNGFKSRAFWKGSVSSVDRWKWRLLKSMKRKVSYTFISFSIFECIFSVDDMKLFCFVFVGTKADTVKNASKCCFFQHFCYIS